MVRVVPSAGFTPPYCDYTNFADSFDLSLLPSGEDLPLSPTNASFYTDFENKDLKSLQVCNPIYLEVPNSNNYHANSPIGALSPYSSDLSHSPGAYSSLESQSFYPASPINQKSEPAFNKEQKEPPAYFATIENRQVFDILTNSILEIKEEVLQQDDAPTVDFSSVLGYRDSENLRQLLESPAKKVKTSEDHQVLREFLRDTSYQKKYNVRPFDFDISIKMEDEASDEGGDLLNTCSEQLTAPVLQIYMEQMKSDIASTCSKLNISSGRYTYTIRKYLVFAYQLFFYIIFYTP